MSTPPPTGLRVVGAGVGRTGTMSLKAALERLLGGPCYHMIETGKDPAHLAAWQAAADGQPVDWPALFANYRAAVDWPAAAFWPEISAAFPDALIVHSTRDASGWYRSASETIVPGVAGAPDGPWRTMVEAVMAARFTPDLADRDAAIAAFHRHNEHVLATAPADRLLAWEASHGWEPLCARLGVEVPDEPFPHTNTTEEFQERLARRR